MTEFGRALPNFRAPNLARMYDYYLGGKDNFPADREAAEKVLAAYPLARVLAVENRRFLERAVEYVAGQGVRQFVDLGTGLPTSPCVHEIAGKIRPDARVVYVDNDPVVTVHSRAICGKQAGVAVVDADIRCPQDILTDQQLTGLVDFSEPVAFLCVAVLHFITDADNPRGIITALRRRMAPGSYLVISHAVTDDASKDTLAAIADVYRDTQASAVARSVESIQAFFAGLELAEPRARRAAPECSRDLRAQGRRGESARDHRGADDGGQLV
jgi:O-methyltransferase involved in polyketide biosynthesis